MHVVFPYLGRKLQYILSYSYNKAGSFLRFQQVLYVYLCRFILFHVHSFFIHLLYFIILSLFGYLALKASRPKTLDVWPNDFDLFFTSVSVSTLSSVSVVETEIFTHNQLIIFIILMLLGGKIFTSMIGLVLAWYKVPMNQGNSNDGHHGSGISPNSRTIDLEDQVELCVLSNSDPESHDRNYHQVQDDDNVDTLNLKRNSIRYMGYSVLAYLIVVYSIGFILVFLYLNIQLTAKEILKTKNLKILTFSVLIVVSSFNNCGLVPINESMMVFKKNSGLLLLLIPQILVGNTLYPPCLRLVTWALGKSTKKYEFFYILKDHQETGYYHMLSRIRCCQLAITVMGLLVTQLLLLCALELNSDNMEGLNSYQKSIAFLFQATNSRHAGESVLDLSTLSSATLVIFIVMMYLPPYATFLLIWNEEECNKKHKKRRNMKNSLAGSLVLSHISYLAIFVILICITERDKLKRDPLNFNLLSTTMEIVGAYGNAGLSIGYSCNRQLQREVHCKQTWTNLTRHYSSKGKVIIILVMLFGKVKNFNRYGGEAWSMY